MSILFYVLGTAFSLTAAVAICIVFTLGSFDTNTAVAQLDSSVPNVPEIEQTEAASRGPASATSLVRISADYPMLSPTPDLAEPANTPVLRATRVSLIADAAHRDQTPPRVPLPPIRKAGPTVGKANSLTADVANQRGVLEQPYPGVIAPTSHRMSCLIPRSTPIRSQQLPKFSECDER